MAGDDLIPSSLLWPDCQRNQDPFIPNTLNQFRHVFIVSDAKRMILKIMEFLRHHFYRIRLHRSFSEEIIIRIQLDLRFTPFHCFTCHLLPPPQPDFCMLPPLSPVDHK